MLPYGYDLDKTSLNERGSCRKDFEDMPGLVSSEIRKNLLFFFNVTFFMCLVLL